MPAVGYRLFVRRLKKAVVKVHLVYYVHLVKMQSEQQVVHPSPLFDGTDK